MIASAPTRPATALIAFVSTLAVASLSACTTVPIEPPTEAVAAAKYAPAFAAARDALVDMGFVIERSDPAGGVLITRPKTSLGLFSPRDQEQSSPQAELEDAFHRQARVVRVRFTPSAPAAATAADGFPVDLRDAGFDTTMVVSVSLLRRQRPGVQVPVASVRMASVTVDPLLADRGIGVEYASAIDQDEPLARRVAQSIRERVVSSTLAR